jgi:LAO/AO transport system kinase
MLETEQQTFLTPVQQEKLGKRLSKAAKDNRIQCSSAFAIAKSLGIPPGEVGKAANKLNIKISKCQLGCF